MVDGIDMGTGAEKGFFGPTNKENAVGGKAVEFYDGGESEPTSVWTKEAGEDEEEEGD